MRWMATEQGQEKTWSINYQLGRWAEDTEFIGQGTGTVCTREELILIKIYCELKLWVLKKKENREAR